MTRCQSIDGTTTYIERDDTIENALSIAHLNKIPFSQILASEHRGKLINYLIDTIQEITSMKKDVYMARPYPCGIRYYKKCFKEFSKVYNIDTFEEDYPEWCI